MTELSRYTDDFNRAELGWPESDAHIADNAYALGDGNQGGFAPQQITAGVHQYTEVRIANPGWLQYGRKIPLGAVHGNSFEVWYRIEHEESWINFYELGGAGYLKSVGADAPQANDLWRFHSRPHPSDGALMRLEAWRKRGAGAWTKIGDHDAAMPPNGTKVGLSCGYGNGDGRMDDFAFGNWDGGTWEGEPGAEEPPPDADLVASIEVRLDNDTLAGPLTGLKAWWWDASLPAGAAAIDGVAADAFYDDAGHFTLPLPDTALAAAGVGYLYVSNSDGTTTQDPAPVSFGGPVAVSAAP